MSCVQHYHNFEYPSVFSAVSADHPSAVSLEKYTEQGVDVSNEYYNITI